MNQLNLEDHIVKDSRLPVAVKAGLNAIENGEFILYPTFFADELSNKLYDHFVKSIEWKQEEMNMYGKKVKFPRLTSWYGDTDKSYSFSGIALSPNKWTKGLLNIKNSIEKYANVNFNSVLLNYYRDGNDSISWHQDDEKELGTNPVIGSVSFGSSRIFQLRHKKTHEKIDIELGSGSLLIMKGELQHYWQHQLPKTKKDIGGRINLTFREIK